MKRLSAIVLSTSLLSMLTACSPVDSVKPFQGEQITAFLNQNRDIKPAQQMVMLSLPQRADWKKVDLSSDNKGRPVILVPIDETAHEWTESIQTQVTAYIGHPDVNAKKMVASAFALANTQCQQAHGTILSQSRQATVYQIEMNDCQHAKNRVITGKAFNGADGVYVVYYTAIQPDINKHQVASMSQVIAVSRLTPA